MNLVFIGSSRFGLRCLDLATRFPGVRIAGVVTAKQSFSISYRPEGVTNVLHADVAGYCEAQGLPYMVLENSMKDPALYSTVQTWRPDAFLVVGWYHMIPRSWRALAPAYGLHASLLPDYSGGAPLVWAMINGEKKTGITLFQMDDGVDSGPIVGQLEEHILPSDTIGSLYARIEDRGLDLLGRHLSALVTGSSILRIQDEAARRTFRQRSPSDGWIDWNQDAKVIDRFIRAQTRPYPGAFTSLDDGRRLTIWTATPLDESNDQPPSSVMQVGGCFRVQCGQGSLLLQEVDCEGQLYGVDQLVEVMHGARRLGIERPQI
ncbi:MAG: methionyl-tRNA formyltransferase [Burkholderiales bacterium]|nr:methionyl-tRNA formyltransferase [Burkholderiales bacterium]